ncbi:MAG: acetyl-CoA carboxylase biotin carboxyl carrier protein subunit [Candidatus Aegiribacteria sp.]|nr:acetyl-CoA carboxylase biotin carboxyl carrier protein subunit [Candidatus Aegiribacteria sp.]
MEKKLDKLIIDDTEYVTEIPDHCRKPYKCVPDPSEITAFIPGTIVEIKVSEGDSVEAGAILLLLDAMKMHNEICSAKRGIIGKIHVCEGDSVQKNQLLISLIYPE